MGHTCQVTHNSAKIIQSTKVNIPSSPLVLESFHKEISREILNTAKNCECPDCLRKFWFGGFFGFLEFFIFVRFCFVLGVFLWHNTFWSSLGSFSRSFPVIFIIDFIFLEKVWFMAISIGLNFSSTEMV